MTRFIVRRKQGRPKDSGYMLLFLMLAVALLTITMLQVARNYKLGIKRDREEEMVHRGVQYARAVQRYYRKNKAYPTSIEQLEKVNNIRYLRKKYADPMSPDGSWQLAHDTDLLSLSLKTGSGLGLTPATGTGSSTSTTSSTTSSQSGSGSDAGSNTGGTTAVTTASGNGILPQGNNTAAGGQVLGGGVMIGVVSKSKAQGIHIFAEKSKYNEWFFIYDPRQDTGKTLIAGPYNPNMIMGTFNTGPVNPNANTPQTPNTGAPGTVAPSAAPPAATPPVATAPTGTP